MTSAPDRGQEMLPGDIGWRPGPFTELRVHGVGNTPLVELLDDDQPQRVAGDETSGFYRSRNKERRLVLGGDSGGEPDPDLRWTDVEAYDWGGFNTGGGWRALWLLLLPFTFVNVAGWLVAKRDRVTRAWVRLFGLGVGLVFVTWLGAMAVELIALRCGWQQACYDRQLVFKPLGWGIFSGDPAHRIALVLVLVPLLVIFVLWWWPGRRTHGKYERSGQDRYTEEESSSQPQRRADDALPLADKTLWIRSQEEVPAAANIHAAALLGALGAGVSWAHWQFANSGFDLALVIGGGGLVLVAVFLVVAGWRGYEDDGAHSPREGVIDASPWLLGLAAAYFVLVLAAAFAIDRGYSTVDWSELEAASLTVADTGELTVPTMSTIGEFNRNANQVAAEAQRVADSMRDAFIALSSAVLGIAFVFLVSRTARLKEKDRLRGRRMWGRWGPAVASMTGLALAAIFVAGVGLWLEEWLGDRAREHLDALGVPTEECLEEPDLCEVQPLGDLQDLLDEELRTPSEIELPVILFLGNLISENSVVLGQPIIELDPLYDILALAFLIVLLVLGVWAGLLEWRLRLDIRGRKKPRIRVKEGEPRTYPFRPALQQAVQVVWREQERTDAELDKWGAVGVRESRKSPRLTRIHRLFWVTAVAVLIVGVMLIVGLFADWAEPTRTEVSDRADFLFTAARWLITAAAVGAAVLVWRSYKPESQESFGGAWDVLTFWPRHYHPFAVPSYSVRAVRQLADRIETLAEDAGAEPPQANASHAAAGDDAREAPGNAGDDKSHEDDRPAPKHAVLLAAHSGGVVIAIAAVALLEDATKKRVALLTYGSPTGSLYGRAYPEYYDRAVLSRVAESLGVDTGTETQPKTVQNGRWANLWRLTDWTGGYCFGDQRDSFSLDETEWPLTHFVDVLQWDPDIDRVSETTPTAEIQPATGHTDYFHDPKRNGPEDRRYQEWRGTLYRRL